MRTHGRQRHRAQKKSIKCHARSTLTGAYPREKGTPNRSESHLSKCWSIVYCYAKISAAKKNQDGNADAMICRHSQPTCIISSHPSFPFHGRRLSAFDTKAPSQPTVRYPLLPNKGQSRAFAAKRAPQHSKASPVSGLVGKRNRGNTGRQGSTRILTASGPSTRSYGGRTRFRRGKTPERRTSGSRCEVGAKRQRLNCLPSPVKDLF